MRRRKRVVMAAMLALAAASEASGQAAGDLKARLDAIVKEQTEAHQRYAKAFEGRPTPDAKRQAVERYLAEVDRHTREVLDLVRAHPDDPAVVAACKFVIETARAGPGDESYQAMAILRDRVRDPGMGSLCGQLFYFVQTPAAEALLRAVMETHPNRDDRGQACYWLATYLRLQAEMVRKIRANPAQIERYVNEWQREATEGLVKAANPEALERESEALLGRVVAEFADLKRWYDGNPLGPVAEGELFAARNLAVGKAAPDIIGRDHEGKPLSLGEYRGKVVVLTFSGNWCGPCVAMYPQERDLVAKRKDRPFALVSVNTDASIKTLAESIASGAITWRCWWDGGTNGPITTRWGVKRFPTIFVLDRDGVIRFKDVRGKDLEGAVNSLLDEAMTGASHQR